MNPPTPKMEDPDHLTKYSSETLFYMFYTQPRDMYQTLAAMQLYERGWRFHKGEQLWITQQTQDDGQGNRRNVYWDPAGWEMKFLLKDVDPMQYASKVPGLFDGYSCPQPPDARGTQAQTRIAVPSGKEDVKIKQQISRIVPMTDPRCVRMWPDGRSVSSAAETLLKRGRDCCAPPVAASLASAVQGGRGAFSDALSEALADGRSLDVSFATFVETRLNFTNWVTKYMSGDQKPRLDSLLTQSARREGSLSSRNVVRSFVEGLAASYNGNLKSMLAFCSDEFTEDKTGGLFGRLTEKQVGGVPVPNPKKAFIGRSLVLPSGTGEGIRLCFVSCHFPITQIAAALEDPLQDPLEAAKIALAKTLRKVLRKAHQRNVTDERTIIFVQGDINSRTVLREGEVNDVLLELLEDESLQSAIQQQLDDLPAGRWREAVSHDSVHDLPVTYKFNNKKVCQTGNSWVLGKNCTIEKSTMTMTELQQVLHADARSIPPKARMSQAWEAGMTLDDQRILVEGQLTLADAWLAASYIGDVMSKASAPKMPEKSVQKQDSQYVKTTSTTSSKRFEGGLYKRTLATLGQEWLDNWGVAFKQKDFRSFRFPSCADRVIYWASDALYDRLSWELPRGGYEINHSQLGSDHRPVSLELILRVSDEPIRNSKALKPARSYMTEGFLSEPDDPSMSEAEEDGFSCEATPRSFQRTSGNMIVFMHLHVLREVAEARTVASSPPAFGEARFLVPDLIVAGGLERSGELGSASCMLLFDPCSALLAEYPPSLVASTSMRHDSDSAAFLCWSYGSALLDRRQNVPTSALQSVTYLCLAGMVEASAWQGFRWLRRGRSAAAALSQMPALSPAGIWPLTGPKSWKVLRMCLRFFVFYFSSLASA
ncbi:not2 [Symbiodinium pilosum]|uniref:Not2 protein n=1 Tax=Symbiodinium pilosum TaxID=2952 RepID=A0A812PPU0_SYMPI|nr:not2 [Symbiodinium pilosum]